MQLGLYFQFKGIYADITLLDLTAIYVDCRMRIETKLGETPLLRPFVIILNLAFHIAPYIPP